MNKFIATGATVLMTLGLSSTAFAQENVDLNIDIDTTIALSADLACMGAAVDAREDAVIRARANFNTRIIEVLNARRVSLKTNYTIANNAERKIAIKATFNDYGRATFEAKAQYRTEVKAAWKTYAEAFKRCNVEADERVGNETRDDDDKKRRNQLKKQARNAFSGSSHGRADVDLSF